MDEAKNVMDINFTKKQKTSSLINQVNLDDGLTIGELLDKISINTEDIKQDLLGDEKVLDVNFRKNTNN